MWFVSEQNIKYLSKQGKLNPPPPNLNLIFPYNLMYHLIYKKKYKKKYN